MSAVEETLLELVADAGSDELRRLRTLLHVAIIRQQSIDRRLATPARLVDPEFPPIVASLCELLTHELARRGDGLDSCPPCAAAIRGSIVGTFAAAGV